MGRRTERKICAFITLAGISCGGQSIRYADDSSPGADDDSSGGASGSASVPSGGTSGTASVPSGGFSGTSATGGTSGTGGSPTDECGSILSAYEFAVQAARACDPTDQLACNAAVASSLPCGCPVTVIANPEIAFAAQASILHACTDSRGCLPCPSLTPPYGCSADGLCTMR